MDFVRIGASQAWQVTALIVVVLVLVRLFARNRPHLAYVLWLVVLAKCVTPPLWSSPSGIFSWVQHAVETTAARPAMPPASLTVEITGSRSIASDLSRDVSSTGTFPEAVGTGDPQVGTTSGYYTLLLIVWIGGGVAALLVNTLRRWRCARRLGQMPTLSVPEFDSVLAELSHQLGISRRVRLMVTTSSIGPAVIGLLRPVIVMPGLVIRGKDPRQLTPVLAHELIHVRRGDLWLGLLQMCAKAIWWFHPMVWWASRLSSREAERCCDEEVIGELGCDAKQYARGLLGILELKRTLEPVPTFPGMKPVEVTSQRLERVMSLRQGCHKRTPRWCWACMLLLGGAALPGAAFVAAQTENGDPGVPAATAVDEVLGFLSLPRSDQLPDEVVVGPYARADHKQAASADAPMLVAIHQSDKVIRDLQHEFNCSEAEAYQAFANLLVREGQLKTSPYPIAQRVRIWNGGVRIAASDEEHQRMLTAVRRMEQHGVSKLALELRFVTAPGRLVRTVITNWQLTPLELGGEPLASAPNADIDPIERPLPTEVSRPTARAGLTTTSHLPALYRIVDADESDRLIETFQQDTRTNLLLAPRITLFNGQSARVADQAQRPFVVGLTTVQGDGGRSAQPQVQVVDIGHAIRLRPIVRGNKVWLDFDVTQSDVGDVELTTVALVGFKKPLTLQVPKVHTARIESTVEFEYDKTVILGGLPANPARNDHQQLLVVVRAQPIGDLGELTYRFAETASMPQFDEPLSQDLAPATAEPAQPEVPLPQPNLYAMVYNVADLVVPRPGFVAAERGAPATTVVVADFDPLIDRITNVAPDTWDHTGGPGAIEPFPTNLSLVISQSQAVHDQIAKLLKQLRSQQHLQVTLEARFVRAPADVWERMHIETGAADTDQLQSSRLLHQQHVILTAQEAERFGRSLDRLAPADTLAVEQVTLFDGQDATIALSAEPRDSESWLALRAACTADRSAIRLTVAVSADRDIPEVAGRQVPDGATLVLNVSDDVTPQMLGMPLSRRSLPRFGGKTPYILRWFESQDVPKGQEMLLLVTPRILVPEEEEERIEEGTSSKQESADS